MLFVDWNAPCQTGSSTKLSKIMSEAAAIQAILLTAFHALLYRYMEQEVVAFHLTLLNSYLDHPKTTKIQTPICGELTTQELRDRLYSQIIELQEILVVSESNQKIQDEQENVHLGLSVSVNLVNVTGGLLAPDTWSIKSYPLVSKTTENLDLQITFLQEEATISGIIHYNTSRFNSVAIQRLVGHLQTLIKGIPEHLDCPISDLPLLTATETQLLLIDWHSDILGYPQVPLYHYIEHHAIQQPNAIAVTFQNQHLTYAELNQRTNQLAHYLNQMGIGPETRVAVCLAPSLDLIICLLGILKAGGVYVPLEPSYPSERLAAILEDIQPGILLTQAQLQSNLPTTAFDRSTIPHIFYCDQDWQTLDQLPHDNPAYGMDLDQTAYVVYTSGTTGKPKGVMASHRNLIHYILVAQDRFGFNQQDIMPAIARFTFSITFFELLSPLVAGGQLVLLEREHILDFPRLIQTLSQVTAVHASPSLLRQLTAYIQKTGLSSQMFQGLRHVSSGGDLVSADLLETLKEVFPNTDLYVIYGCSEVSCMGCTYPVPRDQPMTKSQVGQPFANVSIRLLDTDQQLVPIGVVGEIYISGSGVTQGYLNQPELTQEKFIQIAAQQFYRTGDLGRFDADGNLEILGRSDFQIQLRGIRIELGEVEMALRKVPGIQEGIVVGRDLGQGEPSLVAYVVLDPKHPPTVTQIRRLLATKLPDYMIPAAFVGLETLPVNLNQKVDRRALPQPTAENLLGLDTIMPARNACEQTLIDIWETILGVQPIGIQNNFFDIGGNSLLAVQMLSQVETLFAKRLPITTLLQASTIADLANVLQAPTSHLSQNHAPECDLVLLQNGGDRPPLFCIYGILLYRDLVHQLRPDRPIYAVYLQEEIDLLKPGNLNHQNSVFASVPAIAARYLAAIRAVQPHGPYHLVGESFGGVVAFEMAHQLRAAGEDVALVALFDAQAPSHQTNLSIQRRLNLHWQVFQQQGLSYICQKVEPRLKNLQKQILHYLQGNSSTPSVAHLVQPITNTMQEDVRVAARQRASQCYAPQPYSGSVLLFRAMERNLFEQEDYSLGWASLALGDFQIIDIPGDHLSILQDPQVQVLADHLQQHLDRSTRNDGQFCNSHPSTNGLESSQECSSRNLSVSPCQMPLHTRE